MSWSELCFLCYVNILFIYTLCFLNYVFIIGQRRMYSQCIPMCDLCIIMSVSPRRKWVYYGLAVSSDSECPMPSLGCLILIPGHLYKMVLAFYQDEAVKCNDDLRTRRVFSRRCRVHFLILQNVEVFILSSASLLKPRLFQCSVV